MPDTKIPKETTEAQIPEEDEGGWRTGPNVDIGLEPGAVTVDPHTAAGLAARAGREVHGAKTHFEDGVEVVEPAADTSYNEDPKVKGTSGKANPKAPAVDKQSAAMKRKNPSTIANEPKDIKGDPKADVQ